MQNLQLVESSSAIPSIACPSLITSGELSVGSAGVSPIVTTPPPSIVATPEGGLPPILVADDDPDDRFFIRRLISKTGVPNPVRTFEDGSEVVNYLGAIAAGGPAVRRRAPRLLFIVLKMVGLGGFGFLEWARQQKSALPMTIVVLSNSAESADVARAHELGAHRYLVKYPSVATFATIVRSVYPFAVAQ